MAEDIYYFKSADHRQRFYEAIKQYGQIHPDGSIDEEYGSALYILTMDPTTWSKASGYISDDGILFEQMYNEMDWSGGLTVMVRLAWELFHGEPTTLHATEIARRLDDDNFRIALDAIRFRRDGLRIKP